MTSRTGRHSVMLVYLAVFIGGGLLGWVLDTASRSYNAGHFAPGTLVPFFSLIFAWGTVLLFKLFRFYRLPFWASVLLGTLICIALELTCGLVSQSVFHYRFWDYRAKPYNLDGFIDLRHSIYWFILTLLFRWSVNPWIKKRRLQFYAAR